MGNYWNDNYWRRHLAEPERMDIFEELWIGKHQELIDKLNKGNALDLGCGIGQFTDYWINNGFQVTSADISVNALNALKERTPTATTVELDMSKPLPFEDGTFDVVFANLSIHYFDEETTLALSKEIHRVLKPGAVFHFSSDDENYCDAVNRVMESSGLFELDMSALADVAHIKSDFEKRWLSEGKPVHHRTWRTLPLPEITIGH